ncbi:SDR family NAD(P)-dependent oxidoreductase [Vibrio harveyi]|nr:SDR family NAD(P)-dependent oxidoreductase [Vibrio harveyi]
MKKLVAITGASSGIGLACAKLFSEQGYPVLIMARRKEILDNLNLKIVLQHVLMLEISNKLKMQLN